MTEALLSTARFRPGAPIRPRPALTPSLLPWVWAPSPPGLDPFALHPSPSGTPHAPAPDQTQAVSGCAATGLWKRRAQLRLETCLLPRSGSAGHPAGGRDQGIPGQARVLPFVPAQPLRSQGTLPGECLL